LENPSFAHFYVTIGYCFSMKSLQGSIDRKWLKQELFKEVVNHELLTNSTP